jgi:DNA-binding PadR family transcriptional regulator
MNDLMLLAMLLDQPKHGYALKKQAGLITGQSEMHNNLVYPLLRRFVSNRWVRKNKTAGQRGQTREVYAVTLKGKRELLSRLAQFTSKQAGIDNEFRIRVGLFSLLDSETRVRILKTRAAWLASREDQLRGMKAAVNLGLWGGEAVRFLEQQIAAERTWIAGLERKARREAMVGRHS